MRFTLTFILHYIGLVVLLPIRFLINLIVRFIGYSNKPIFQRNLFETKYMDKDIIIETRDKLQKEIDTRLQAITDHGDGCKFFGLLVASNPKPEYIKYFVNYVTDNGLFIRRQSTIGKTINKTGNFSGDMWAGFLPACVEIFRLYSKQDTKTKKTIEKFKSRLIKAIDKALFEEPYLTFKSNYKKIDRGYLFRYFFGNAGHYLAILSMLILQYKLTNKMKYRILYYLIYPLFFIDSLVNPTFYIRFKDYRYTQEYFVHSNFILYYYLYKLTGNEHYKKCYEFIRDKFDYNPEFNTLICSSPSEDCYRDILIFLSDYIAKIKEDINYKDLYKYVEFQYAKELKCIIKDRLIKRQKDKTCIVKESKQIIPPRFLSNDYLWEKSFVIQQTYKSATTGIDFVRLSNILESKNILK